MKILMKILAAGPNGVRLPGKSYDVDDAAGRELVAGNYAEAVAQQEVAQPEPPPPPIQPERAIAPPPPVQHATAPAIPGKRKR